MKNKLKISDIPADFEVKPLKQGQKARDIATCGTCGLSWDDSISTSITPTPSGRCPFEYFHDEIEDEPQPDEEDIFFSDSGPLGARTSLVAGGKFLGEFSDFEEAEEAALKWVEKSNYYPNAWIVSDHGNVELYSLDEKKKKKKKNPSKKRKTSFDDRLDEANIGKILHTFEKVIGIENAISDEVGEEEVDGITFKFGDNKLTALTPEGILFRWFVKTYGNRASYQLHSIIDEHKEEVGEIEKTNPSKPMSHKELWPLFIDDWAKEILKTYDDKIGIEKAILDKIGEREIGEIQFRYGGREVSALTPEGILFTWFVDTYGDRHSYMLHSVTDEYGEEI